MASLSILHCDCCGLSIASTTPGEDCPRCGYPVDSTKEEHFLRTSLRDLWRVATHGGANMSVTDLIKRYQTRLDLLLAAKQAATTVMPATSSEHISAGDLSEIVLVPMPEDNEQEEALAVVSPSTVKQNSANVAHVENVPAAAVSDRQARPERMFSLRTFLEDQTINIIASLGAFLILVGSLSFVATTPNLLLSFLIMFGVHAVFGVTGIASYRFRSFRIVAVIYTAIFALLVPLVGFSGYRLIAGNLIHLSTPTLIAITAGYAMVVYGILAIYQRFTPFAYLSIISLIVADIATASAAHLDWWWWPSMLMVLALPSVLSLARKSGDTGPFTDMWAVFLIPVRILMFVTLAVGMLGFFVIFSYSFGGDMFGSSSTGSRFALLSIVLLLLAWNCLEVWRTQHMAHAAFTPYIFVVCSLIYAYAFHYSHIRYVLTLTGVAVLYHLLNRFAALLLQRFGKTEQHIEALALIIVALLPFIATPSLPGQLLGRAVMYSYNGVFLPLNAETVTELAAIIVGCALTFSVIVRHTGLRKIPGGSATWPWLLLLSGFLLNWAYSMVALWLHFDLTWSYLGFTLATLLAAIIVRRHVSVAWANPLDVVVLYGVVQTLVMSSTQGIDRIIFLELLFASLFYIVLLYQRRQQLLFVPLLFALLALPVLLQRPRILFVISLLLPFIAVGVHRLITNHWNAAIVTKPAKMQVALLFVREWEWPLVAIGILYGITFMLNDMNLATSTMQNWLQRPLSVALELAALALVWYMAAVVSRIRWWLVLAVIFAFAGLLLPSNQFAVLAWLAPSMAIIGLIVSRRAGKAWALPLYVTSIFAACMIGVQGATQGQFVEGEAVWVLQGFAILIYLIGAVENLQALLWVGACFAVWSAYDAGQRGDLYRLPIVALVCAGLGVGIGCLRFVVPALARKFSAEGASRGNRLLRYALPVYATALAAAVLTGIYGSVADVNHPFYTAIPDALLVYALIAYAVALFERKAIGQWLVVLFVVWGTALAPQIATQSIPQQLQGVLYYLAGIVLGTGVLGLVLGRFVKNDAEYSTGSGMAMVGRVKTLFAWNWSWYLSMLISIFMTVTWSYNLAGKSVVVVFCAFILLALVIMLVERAPEMLIVAALLAALTISRTSWLLWEQMVAYSLLCVLLFASQFIWTSLQVKTRTFPAVNLHRVLGLGGQILVVLAIIVEGGLSPDNGWLTQVGAGSMFILAALIFWLAYLQTDRVSLRSLVYSAGLMLSLSVSWELLALHQTQLDWLTIAPATYLIVIAPFLLRDETLPQHQQVGHFAAIMGASLLLLPMLWLSFNEDNLLHTLILGGESLVLLLAGVTLRVRFFVLSGAALMIVAAIHTLFFPTLGIPLSVALAILGGFLLAIATGLTLARHRLRSAWVHWQ